MAEPRRPATPHEAETQEPLRGMGARLTPNQVARLDAVAAALPTLPGSAPHTRAVALRAAVEEGLLVLESRYGVRREKRGR